MKNEITNPFITAGYAGSGYICSRKFELEKIVRPSGSSGALHWRANNIWILLEKIEHSKCYTRISKHSGKHVQVSVQHHFGYLHILRFLRKSSLKPVESIVALRQLFIHTGNIKFPRVEIPPQPGNEAFIFFIIWITQDL